MARDPEDHAVTCAWLLELPSPPVLLPGAYFRKRFVVSRMSDSVVSGNVGRTASEIIVTYMQFCSITECTVGDFYSVFQRWCFEEPMKIISGNLIFFLNGV